MKRKLETVMDEHVHLIWQCVRENRHTLDSERVCRMIREGITLATADVREVMREQARQLSAVRQKIRDLKRAEVGAGKRIAGKLRLRQE